MSFDPASLHDGLGSSPNVKNLPKSPDGEGFTRTQLAALRAAQEDKQEVGSCGGGGGLSSSPIVAALPHSQDGEGLTRDQLRALEASSLPISTFRNSTSSDASSPTTFTTSLFPSRSFHASLLTTLSSPSPSPPSQGCSLTFIYHFSSSIILDPYQIAQLHEDGALSSRRSSHASSSTWRFFGETELELPVGRVGPEGNGLVLEFTEEVESVEIPVHGRYLEVLSREEEREGKAASREVAIEWPWVGWVCNGSVKQASLSSSSPVASSSPPPSSLPPPFPSDLFSQASVFHSFQPLIASSNPVSLLTLPVGRASHLPFVEAGTTAAIWLTAGWVCYKAWRSFRRAGTSVVPEEVEGRKKQ